MDENVLVTEPLLRLHYNRCAELPATVRLELRNYDLLKAIETSRRSFDVIITFLKANAETGVSGKLFSRDFIW